MVFIVRLHFQHSVSTLHCCPTEVQLCRKFLMQLGLSVSACTNIVLLCSSQAHLVDGRASAGASVDSARQNLAATFVNGFVNAGFGVVCS